MEVFGWKARIPESPSQWLAVLAVLGFVVFTNRLAGGRAPAVFAGIVAALGFSFDRHLYIPMAIGIAAVFAMLSGRRSTISQHPRSVWREAALIGGGFMLYEWGRTLVIGERATAIAHGEAVLRLETRLHLAIEKPLQGWLLEDVDRIRFFNEVYSRAFLAVTIGTLFFLLLTDDRAYRLYRTCLGLSSLLAVIAIGLYPTAPPRLLPNAGILDTHVLMGRHHGFVNEFAAIPSLHVGWMALCGVVLWWSLRSPWRWFALVFPGSAMLFTVMVTGNHFWLDGAIGALFAAVPAVAAIASYRRLASGAGDFRPALDVAPGLAARLTRAALISEKQAFTTVTLGMLFAYLTIREIAEPGFTNYWGYMLAQIAATIVVSIWLENRFIGQGGLAWHTHLIVVIVTWADTLGTAGHMYDNWAVYDKITHFLGIAAIAAASADVFGCMYKRGTMRWPLAVRLAVAVGFGVALGGMWEIYEYLGDVVFHTGRHNGAEDTIYDLISDTAGAVVVALFLWWRWSGVDESTAVDTKLGDAVPAD